MDIVVSSDIEAFVEAFAPKPKETKKSKKPRNQETKKPKKSKTPATGMEVIETLEEAPSTVSEEPQKIVNECHIGYTPQEIEKIVKTANEFKFPYEKLETPQPLPSYEHMMNDLFGPSSMETQPDLEPVEVLEDGVAVTQDGRTVEWWPVDESPFMFEYMHDGSIPLHTSFLLPDQGQSRSYYCPVFFGRVHEKGIVVEALCNEIHPRIQQKWGTFSCHCGLVPTLKLSQTPKNPNKVFLTCPKVREARCNYFQWTHEPPKPVRMSKACSPTTLKKRLASMVTDRMSLEKKQKTEGGFTFPPVNNGSV